MAQQSWFCVFQLRSLVVFRVVSVPLAPPAGREDSNSWSSLVNLHSPVGSHPGWSRAPHPLWWQGLYAGEISHPAGMCFQVLAPYPISLSASYKAQILVPTLDTYGIRLWPRNPYCAGLGITELEEVF